MRISDWSSDVCSSDLGAFAGHLQHVFSHSLLSFPLLGRRRAAEAMRASRRGRGIGLPDLLARLQSQYWPRQCARIGDDRAHMAASSEERRVGKEWASACQSRWTPHQQKQKTKKK